MTNGPRKRQKQISGVRRRLIGTWFAYLVDETLVASVCLLRDDTGAVYAMCEDNTVELGVVSLESAALQWFEEMGGLTGGEVVRGQADAPLDRLRGLG